MTGLKGERGSKAQVILGKSRAAAFIGKERSGNRIPYEEQHLTFPPLKATSLKALFLGKKGKSQLQEDLSGTTKQTYNIDQQGSNFDFIYQDKRGRLILDLSKWAE